MCYVYSRYVMKPGDKLFYDYSTKEDEYSELQKIPRH